MTGFMTCCVCTAQAQIHLLGNLVVWTASSISIVIYLFLAVFYYLRRQRSFVDVTEGIWAVVRSPTISPCQDALISVRKIQDVCVLQLAQLKVVCSLQKEQQFLVVEFAPDHRDKI